MKNKRKTGRIMSFVTALAMSLSMLGGVATNKFIAG